MAGTSTARDVALEVRSDEFTVVVVAGIRVYREGLCELLRASRYVAGAASARGLEEAAILARAIGPDVLIVDVSSADGLLIARRLVDAGPHVPVIGAGLAERERDVVAAAEAGLDGFVGAEADVEELVATARSAARGELLCSPRVAAILRRRITALARGNNDHETDRLTAREREVMRLVDDGLSNREVALRLRIEVSTVKNHMRNVFEKLDVRDRGAAAARLRVTP